MERTTIFTKEFKDIGLEKMQEIQYKLKADSTFCNEDIFFAEQIRDVPNKSNMKLGKIVLIVICTEGHAVATINGRKYEIQKNDMVLFVQPDLLLSAMVSTDFRCNIAGISMQKIQEIIHGDGRLVEYYFFFNQHPVIHLAEDEVDIFERYKALSRPKKDIKFKKEVTNGILQAMLYEVLSFCAVRFQDYKEQHMVSILGNPVALEDSNSHEKDIAKRFLTLLVEDDGNHRSVQHFADQLCITPKYLSTIVKSVTGRSPSAWIQEKTIDKICKLLTTTAISCKEIAFQMDFCNSSSFGKYVKHNLGCSPQEYRKKNRVQL